MVPQPAPDFLSVVTRLGYVESSAASLYLDEGTKRGVSPTQVALQHGALTPVQVEIVETLLKPHDAIPGYEILDVLGYGGMGAVFRAKQKNLDRLVALKTVLVSQMSGPAALARFEQEATTIGRLVHPHIIGAFDFGRHQGRLFLAMELVAGEDAEDLLVRRGPLDEATTWHIVRQAAAGLAHAAQQGIVHRDIKPANLMLVKPPAGFPLPAGIPQVKIGDFGLALLVSEPDERTRLTSTGTALGSPHYMAPEQLTTEPLDFRADIYALGATAYHLLAGKPPFYGMAISALVGQKLSSGPEPLSVIAPHVSQHSATLVADLMQRDPDRRPADYETLLARCDAMLQQVSAVAGAPTGPIPVGRFHGATAETQPVAADPTPISVPTWRGPRWSLVGAFLAVTLVVGVGSWLGWHFYSSPGKPTLTPSGAVAHLFTGESLAGWKNQGGSWKDSHDGEGAPVIEGANGVLVREIPGWNPLDPSSGFQLTFTVNLRNARAVELHFDLPVPPSANSPRSVLQLSPEGTLLGTKRNERGPLRAVSRLVPWRRIEEDLHDVTLEKHSQGWWLWVDGDPVGALRARSHPAVGEFRLVVEGGPAWFADFAVEPLARNATE